MLYELYMNLYSVTMSQQVSSPSLFHSDNVKPIINDVTLNEHDGGRKVIFETEIADTQHESPAGLSSSPYHSQHMKETHIQQERE